MLLATDREKKTAWHLAAEKRYVRIGLILHRVWKSAEEKLTTEYTIYKLLLGTDSEGKTALHWAAMKGNL